MFWTFTPGTTPVRLGGLMERVVMIEIWCIALGWQLFVWAREHQASLQRKRLKLHARYNPMQKHSEPVGLSSITSDYRKKELCYDPLCSPDYSGS